jgi:hypothetical protein
MLGAEMTHVLQKPLCLVSGHPFFLDRAELPVERVVNTVLLRPAIDERAVAGTSNSRLYRLKNPAGLLCNAANDSASAHCGPSVKAVSWQMFSRHCVSCIWKTHG